MASLTSSGACSPSSVNKFSDENTNTTFFEVHERGTHRWIRLEVAEPVTITAKNFLHLSTSFTTYLIRIDTNHYAFSLPYSEVRRRYSEFCWLRAKLAYHHPNKVVPPLPPKKFFHMTKFNEQIIEERRFALGKFLQRVMRSSVLLSDSALHLFLQSDLSTKEIDDRICSEELPAKRIPSSPITMKEAVRHNRPYLFRSVSCSSSSDGNSSEVSIEDDGIEVSAMDEYDISSSEECGDFDLSA